MSDITKALESACRMHGKQAGNMSSKFWKLVFENYYGQAPTGDDDPRWKQLFTIGYPALRDMLGVVSAE